MPAKSKAQQRFMEMIAHNPEIAKEHGMSPERAKEYVSHNTGEMSYKNLPETVKKPRFGKLFKK